MDELAHDLASALDETSEQNRLDEEIWDGPVLCPRQQQRRQARKRRGRKRRSNSNHSLDYARCYSEASESSQDEVGGGGGIAGGGGASDSDDDRAVVKRLSSLNVTLKGKYHTWHESDSFTENTPGQPLRRRRKVKRVTSGGAGDVSATLQKKLKVSEPRLGSQPPSCSLKAPCQHKKQRLCKAPSAESWLSSEALSIEPSLRLEEARKEGMDCETKEHKASDENMTDSDASSVCSSDGLFTNDEGRQGDDEQSDWFYEGECEQGFRIPKLLPHCDPQLKPPLADEDQGVGQYTSPAFLLPSRPAQRGYHARLNRLPGIAARCIRKGRRRLTGKEGPVGAIPNERVSHFGQDPYQKELRRNFCVRGQYREWSVLNRLQSLRGFNPLVPLYPLEVLTDSSHRKCSTLQHKSSRQTSVHLGSLCTGDVKRRRKTATVTSPASAATCHHGDSVDLSPEDAGSSKSSASMDWVEGQTQTGSGAEKPGSLDRVEQLIPRSPAGPARL
ncbi:G patch domain-containing protein 2-like isoform X2 [Carcharodon carcharias]|uniref:G patch domain-containing protein 2-like isoform X2 n=1 Tax=Carcharodon carcharias TaxID=13397 RepID=UPI001B7E012D|nr:G patch domain-containing protein 2-like isoform X2 [Carcharodon carcharias]